MFNFRCVQQVAHTSRAWVNQYQLNIIATSNSCSHTHHVRHQSRSDSAGIYLGCGFSAALYEVSESISPRGDRGPRGWRNGCSDSEGNFHSTALWGAMCCCWWLMMMALCCFAQGLFLFQDHFRCSANTTQRCKMHQGLFYGQWAGKPHHNLHVVLFIQ